MNLTAADIESIVRQVVTTWTAGAMNSVTPVHPSVPSNEGSTAKVEGKDSELAVRDSVISISTIQSQLAGKSLLRVAKNAVVTPAVKDLCRERKIHIVRGFESEGSASTIGSVKSTMRSEPEATAKSNRPQRLIVAGTSSAMDGVLKQLCPKQANVVSRQNDDASAVRAVLEGIQNGHQAGVLWVESAHASLWQAARHDKLRPVVVSQWSDLSDAVREVPLNVLILSTRKWSLPALCNASRMLFEHLQKNS